MYSIVLMAAISGGPNTTGADQPMVAVAAPAVPVATIGCTGCTGCTGCYGCSGYSSCYGSCHGRGGFLGHRRSGCCGGVAYSCSGCCGGGYSSGCCGGGFLGHKRKHGCCGGYSCFGSCSGYGCWGSCSGYGYGYGGGYSGFSGIPYFYPTYPAYSTPITTGAAPYYYPGTIRTPATPAAPVQIPESKPDTPKSDTPKSDAPPKKSTASLKFQVPAGAVIYVDGQKTPGQGTERSFYTPSLEAGQKYFYDVRAEIAIGGRTFSEEKRVVVEAGAEITESFPKMVAAIAETTTVAGK